MKEFKIFFGLYKNILVTALLLRIILMPLLFHADLKTQYYHGHFLSDGVLNIYTFINKHKEELPYKDTFNYPPLPFYLFGIWEYLAGGVLGGSYEKWLNNWGDFWFTSDQIFRQLFVLKLPYLFVDLLLAFALTALADETLRKRLLILWLFNPLSIYIIYGLSTFDIIPTFFMLLSILFFKKQKFFYSGLALGIGAAVKLYPLLVLPFFAGTLYSQKKYKETCDFIFGAIALPILTIGPFFKDFINHSDNGLLLKLLQNSLNLGDIKLPYFAIVYILAMAIYFIPFFGVYKNADWKKLLGVIIIVFWGVFLGTKFHPQWFLWVIPFYLILASESFVFLLMLVPVVFFYLFQTASFKDAFLTLGVISPILPGIYDTDFISTGMFRYANSEKLNLIFRSVFIIYSAGILYLVIKTVLFGKISRISGVLNFWPRVGEMKLLAGSLLILISGFAFMIWLGVYYTSEKDFVTAQLKGYRGVQFYKDNPINQNFYSEKEGLNLIYIRLKNINLMNRDPVTLKLEENGQIVREVTVPGGSVRDDDFVRFKFEPIKDSARKTYSMSINSTSTFIPESIKADVSENGELVYKVYRKKDELETLRDMSAEFAGRLYSDKAFAVFWLTLVYISVIFYFKRSTFKV